MFQFTWLCYVRNVCEIFSIFLTLLGLVNHTEVRWFCCAKIHRSACKPFMWTQCSNIMHTHWHIDCALYEQGNLNLNVYRCNFLFNQAVLTCLSPLNRWNNNGRYGSNGNQSGLMFFSLTRDNCFHDNMNLWLIGVKQESNQTIHSFFLMWFNSIEVLLQMVTFNPE